MVLKKVDKRIRTLIENNVKTNMRSFFVIVGDKGKEQIHIIHHMMTKATLKAIPNVLWCYKRSLGHSSNYKKRMRLQNEKRKVGALNDVDDPLSVFLSATEIRYTYYKETSSILGNTYGMCILQDFDGITPNLLARTIETVEGGGAVIILLKTMTSLRQLYTMSMDVHARYRTEAHYDIVARFNERFILSLSDCPSCLVVDDQLNVLPLAAANANIVPVPPKDDSLSEKDEQLALLKESLVDTQPVGVIVKCCRTLDQAHAVLKFVESISEKTLRSTVALTAARGRGKSAALGLAMASAVAFGYSNIFVTSPSPENLKTLFDFVFKGFDALDYKEHLDYDVVQSTNAQFRHAVIRVNIYKEHRQTIQYIHPHDAAKLGQAELVVIDEAAAIPLPLVKSLLGPYLVFMSSTINGYEGTGRSLSLKLIQQLRNQCSTFGGNSSEAVRAANMSTSDKEKTTVNTSGRQLHEITLNESIRYAEGDHVEAWLNKLLCLDATTVAKINSGCPSPDSCELYYVNRDTLFSYHRASEEFLQRLMSLYVSSHYKNSPDDLQMLSDSPAHHIFCLLPPVDRKSKALPEVLTVLQVCFEGEISKQSLMENLRRGKRASGDLIPWTLSQQFQDHEFGTLSGGRIVRIATHPDYQGMGYGKQSIKILQQYFEGKIPNIDEDEAEIKIETADDEGFGLLEEQLSPRKNLPPLLSKLSERRAEALDYLGVSYGLTSELLRFWKKCGFTPVYIRQTQNSLTGENSCIMLKSLNEEESDLNWLELFNDDFRKRFISLLSFEFRNYQSSVALNVLQKHKTSEDATEDTETALTISVLNAFLSKYDVKRLEMYADKLLDHHLVMDLVPTIARFYFLEKLPQVKLSFVQQALLLGVGLQHKNVDTLAEELDMPSSQLLGLYNRIMRKCVQYFNQVLEHSVGETVEKKKEVIMEPVEQTLNEELAEEMQKHSETVFVKPTVVRDKVLASYQITGREKEWEAVTAKGNIPDIVSIKAKASRKRPLKTQHSGGSGGKKPDFLKKNKYGLKKRK